MARQLITKTDAVAAAVAVDDDLPELTPQQMQFVHGLLEGKTGADAYRAAYDCSNSLPKTVWGEATKLRSHPGVAQWLSAARKAYLGSAVVTQDSHVRELERLREIALDSGNVGAAVQAEQLRGKASALYVERYENVTPPDPVRVLEAMDKLYPGLARLLAAKAQMPIDQTTVIDAVSEPIEAVPGNSD